MSDGDDFYRGALFAMRVILDVEGMSTSYEECVGNFGLVNLIRVAKKDGDMRWSGLSKFLRDYRHRHDVIEYLKWKSKP